MSMSVTDSYTQSQTRLQTSVTEVNVATAHWRLNAANAHLAAVMGPSLRRHCRQSLLPTLPQPPPLQLGPLLPSWPQASSVCLVYSSTLTWAHCLQPESPHTAATLDTAHHSFARRCTASLARCMLKILGLGSGLSIIFTSSCPDSTFSWAPPRSCPKTGST